MKKPEFTHFTLEEQDGIGVFTIHRPEALNAMNPAVWEDLTAFADYLEHSDLRVAIITGEGRRAFIAGTDIKALMRMGPADGIHGEIAKLSPALRKLETGSKPVIAAINGYALGGGLEVALACDIRILSENATLGLPELGLGLIPGAGGTQRLARIAGVGVAKHMILARQNLTAAEAAVHGLTLRVVPEEQLMEEAMKVARRIAEQGSLAVQTAKQLINSSLDVSLDAGIMMETYAFSVLLGTEDKQEGTSAFVEKRKPTFHDQ